MSVVSGKSFSPFQRHIKFVEVEMDGAAICRREEEIGLLLLQNRPPFSGVTYLLCIKTYMGLGLPHGTRQQRNNSNVNICRCFFICSPFEISRISLLCYETIFRTTWESRTNSSNGILTLVTTNKLL